MNRADNLTTFMRRFSRNPGTSSFWKRLDLSRLVMELLYLYLYCNNLVIKMNSVYCLVFCYTV